MLREKFLESFSSELLQKQRDALFAVHAKSPSEPLDLAFFPEGEEQGQVLLSEGRVACVILAGGQGSRLGWEGPKALYPIFPEKNLTLLRILLEKAYKSSLDAGCRLPVAIMTSPFNHAEIKGYLEENAFFGFDPLDVTLFPQSLLPLLDESGNWVLEAPGRLALGPDGNGGVFKHLDDLGVLQLWQERGIERITILPIDNPLAIPFDPRLLHHARKNSCDVVAKCILRENAEESVGIFAKKENRLCVIEYFEAQAEKTAQKEDGSFLWPFANINLFCFSLTFAKKIAQKPLPWHIAWKKAVAWERGEIRVAKCESFLFDLLPYCERAELLVYPRECIYAPLKNKEGDKSPESVRNKILSLL